MVHECKGTKFSCTGLTARVGAINRICREPLLYSVYVFNLQESYSKFGEVSNNVLELFVREITLSAELIVSGL